jgi:hypothetical protein
MLQTGAITSMKTVTTSTSAIGLAFNRDQATTFLAKQVIGVVTSTLLFQLKLNQLMLQQISLQLTQWRAAKFNSLRLTKLTFLKCGQ